MVSDQHKHTCITFNSRLDTINALQELKNTGFPMEQISVVAKDADHEDQFCEAGMGVRVGETPDRNATFGTLAASMLGAIGGCLVGIGMLAIPGIGPFVTVGISGKVLITTIAGAGIGAASSGLLETLGLGMRKDQIEVYSDRCCICKYMVIVEGTDEEVCRAKSILKEWRI